MLELYHWAPNGPWLKPLIVLAEKNIACTLRPVDVLAFEQYGPAMPAPSLETRLNLEGEGPLLVHDGRQMTESFFMCEYLDAAFAGPALRPSDPVAFNRMLAWARFINEVLMPAANTLGCKQYLAPALANKTPPLDLSDRITLSFVREGWRRAYSGDYPPELVAESRRKVGIALKRLETTLADRPWILGAEYSLTDIDAFAVCRSLPLLTPDLIEDHPRCADWMARMQQRPAVRESLAVGNWEHPETAFAPGPEHARWG
jgi:GSH-dependent disulfide-bond oxidoreductase